MRVLTTYYICTCSTIHTVGLSLSHRDVALFCPRAMHALSRSRNRVHYTDIHILSAIVRTADCTQIVASWAFCTYTRPQKLRNAVSGHPPKGKMQWNDSQYFVAYLISSFREPRITHIPENALWHTCTFQ